MTAHTEQDVLDAADALVTAFASGDSAAYFTHFAPDATFVFYTHTERLASRAAYEALWRTWETEDDFRVLACTSSNRMVQLVGDVAIFTHDVETTVSTRAGVETLNERETIVFAHDGTAWKAAHEHLSPAGQ